MNGFKWSRDIGLCESAGIGRQARLRGVCQPTWEFKSPLSHQNQTAHPSGWAVFLLSKDAAPVCAKMSAILLLYHQLTRTHTVLTGGNVSKRLQSPCRDTKYRLRAFHCLNAFSLQQNCFSPDGFGFPSDFCFLSRRCVLTHQGEKNKKRRKDLPSGVCALVN